MEDSTAVKGVFLYTKKLDSELMVKCLQAMLNIFPDIKFTSVTSDEKYSSYRVRFSSPNEEGVLAKKLLTVSGEDIPICPLSTCLTLHYNGSKGDDLLESDIREAVNIKFGEPLNIAEIPRSPSLRNANIKTFRAYINIPEAKELQIFDYEESPEIWIGLPNKKLNLRVTVFCRNCKEDGHIAQDCHPVRVTTKERATSINHNSMSADSTMKIDFHFESTESYAGKIGREEIMKKGYLSEGNRKVEEAERSTSNPETKESKENKLITIAIPVKGIKKEKEVNDSHDMINTQRFQNNENQSNANKDPSINHQNNEESTTLPNSEDEIQIIGCSNKQSSSKDHRKGSFKCKNEDAAANLDENSNSRSLESPIKTSLSFASSSTPGPSNSTPVTSRPSIAVEVTSVLSESLQKCINTSCEDFRIIDRKKLDAFLIHVKKKSNPIRVAVNYTSHVAKLKELLQSILEMYYATPQAGTKEDIKFIKWLEELVKRFDGKVPKKRKRKGESHDVSPAKK